MEVAYKSHNKALQCFIMRLRKDTTVSLNKRDEPIDFIARMEIGNNARLIALDLTRRHYHVAIRLDNVTCLRFWGEGKST